MNEDKIFIVATNQQLKFLVPIVPAWIGAIICVIGFRYQSLETMFVGVVIGFAAFVAMCLSVRCPSCGKFLAWYSFNKRSDPKSIEWLKYFIECPFCEYNPAKDDL